MTAWRVTAVVWLAVAWAVPSSVAWACASCGSGGDEPLIVYPNEDVKVYVGASRMSGFGYVKADGSAGTAVAPRARDSVMVAFGKAIGPRAFFTLALPAVRNEGDDAVVWGAGDLLTSARFTLLSQTIAAPWWPQVQLVASFRDAISASIYDAQRPDLLDAFGTGFDEGRLGVDIWFGMFAWRAGGAVMGLWPFARSTPGGLIQPGPALRTVLTAGYGVPNLGQVMISWTRDGQGALAQNGSTIAESGRVVQGFGASVDTFPSDTMTLRLTASRVADFGSRNAVQATTFGLAAMRAW